MKTWTYFTAVSNICHKVAGVVLTEQVVCMVVEQ